MKVFQIIYGFLFLSLVACSGEKQETTNTKEVEKTTSDSKPKFTPKKDLKVISILKSANQDFSAELLLADSLQMKKKLKNGELESYVLPLHDLLVKTNTDTLAYFASENDQLLSYSPIVWFKNNILLYAKNGPRTADNYYLFDPIKKESYLLEYWEGDKLATQKGLENQNIQFQLKDGKVSSHSLK